MQIAKSNQLPAWYCPGGSFQRLIKWSLTGDRGTIEFFPGLIHFSGKKTEVACTEITKVSLTGFYWPCLVHLAIGDALILLGMFGGLFSFFTLENPATPILILAVNLFALAAWPLRWIEVEYRDECGNPVRAYFSDGSTFGKNFGGTRRLEQRIRQAMPK